MEQRERLISFYYKQKRMPTYAELMRLWGYKTKSAVDYALRKLVEEGVVSKDKSGKLIPRNLYRDVKVLGVVEAGFPTAAEEELVDTMSLDDFLVKNKESAFLLRVKGDSMKNAGIMEGDLVLVERGRAPKAGEIVIARVDGEFTMKYYRTKGGRAYLEAANENYAPIYPAEELSVEAVVTAVIRKY
jgi:repressor LexA